MTIELIEIAPNRWRVRRPERPVARSDLPMPHVISDEMPETEQVDGRYYTSKAAFRAVGRSLGLTEVGTERPKPRKYRDLAAPEIKRARRQAIHTAVEKYKAGHRAGGRRA